MLSPIAYAPGNAVAKVWRSASIHPAEDANGDSATTRGDRIGDAPRGQLTLTWCPLPFEAGVIPGGLWFNGS